MAIVWACEVSVEDYAAAGREVTVPRPGCPVCDAPMVFCGWYRRAVRRGDLRVFTIWVRRARCRGCRSGHALLPSFCLVGRLDVVEVIGPAVEAVVGHTAVRELAAVRAGVPATTVRGWCRRHRRRAHELTAGMLTVFGVPSQFGCMGGPADLVAVATLVVVGSAVSACLDVTLWSAVSVLTDGRWLSVHMNPRWADATRKRLMVLMSELSPP